MFRGIVIWLFALIITLSSLSAETRTVGAHTEDNLRNAPLLMARQSLLLARSRVAGHRFSDAIPPLLTTPEALAFVEEQEIGQYDGMEPPQILRHDTLAAVRPAVYYFAAGICASLLAFAQSEGVPTFGTTVVVPGGLVGFVYHISPLSKSLPYFPALDPVGVIYASSLNVPPRNFQEGFPGITGRFEWFAIDYNGRFWIEKPGMYQFALTSDDGARLYIDDEQIVDNDGIHPPDVRRARVLLGRGIHRMRVSYFQGPRYEVALILQVAGPGEDLRVFSTDEFRPPPNPEDWDYRDGDSGFTSTAGRLELRVSPSAASPGDDITVELALRPLPGRSLVGATWEIVIPAQIVDLVSDGPEISRAVSNSGKFVNCNMKKPYLSKCTLAGRSEKPMESGSIAKFHFTIRSGVQHTTTTFRIERVEATTADRRRFALTGDEGTLTIH